MIHQPWSDGTGAYYELDNWDDVRQFCKRRRNLQSVIFRPDGDLLPIACAICGELITNDENRVDIIPQKRIISPKHYYCAWEDLLGRVYSLAGRISRVHCGDSILVYQNGELKERR